MKTEQYTIPNIYIPNYVSIHKNTIKAMFNQPDQK